MPRFTDTLFLSLALLGSPLSSLCAQESTPETPPPSSPAIPDAGQAINIADPINGRGSSQGGLLNGRQFIVHGTSIQTRVRLLGLATELSEKLIRLLGEDDPQNPIVIELIGQPGDPLPARNFSREIFTVPGPDNQGNANGGSFRLQLNLSLARGINRDQFQDALLDLILIERSLHDIPTNQVPATLRISPWLRQGLLEAFLWQEKIADRDFYAALFNSGGLFPIDKLLNLKSNDELALLDAGTRSSYRASCGALVLSLLKQSEGKKTFRALLKELPSHQGEPILLLRKHFDGLNLSEKSLLKWWQLQMAELAEAPVTRLMSILETEAELKKALHLRFNHPSLGLLQYQPSTYDALLQQEPTTRRRLIQPAADELSLLAYRAFPDYRPFISAYLVILQKYAQHPVLDPESSLEKQKQHAEQTDQLIVESRTFLRNLTKERTLVFLNGERTRDYLDWYQINTAQQLSGKFNDYYDLKQDLLHPTQKQQRKGPVSEYLNDLDPLFKDD